MSAGGSILVVGATGGLGESVVRALVLAGHVVHFTGRRAERLVFLQKEVPGAIGHAVDATREAAIRGLVEEVDAAVPLAGYVHLAGGWAGGTPIDELSAGDWEEMLARNWTTALNGATAAFRVFRRRGGGSIVTVGALAGLQGGAGAAPYSVAKAAVIAFTRCLAEEGKALGVRANCIVPGILDTEANRRAMPQADRRAWTQTDSVAEAVVFLCGGESAGVNGSLLVMKGQL